MTNCEKYKKDIDLVLQQGKDIAFNKDTKEIIPCADLLDCEDCLFSHHYNKLYCCSTNIIKWLAEEYKEPKIDWSKVPVDTPVLVSSDGKKWNRRHFSRVIDGIPYVWMYGGTSWTSYNSHNNEMTYSYIKLAEVE